MKESCKQLLSYARAITNIIILHKSLKYDFHIHVPEATPKDGPSAGGVALCVR